MQILPAVTSFTEAKDLLTYLKHLGKGFESAKGTKSKAFDEGRVQADHVTIPSVNLYLKSPGSQ